MAAIAPHRRPQYPPTERMAILELKAARGWSLKQTAKAFLVTAATIASWMKRLDEDGPDALVQLPPGPSTGSRSTSATSFSGSRRSVPRWARSRSPRRLPGPACTWERRPLGRMLKQKPPARTARERAEADAEGRIVTAKYPGHVWHVDLTAVPTGGFWTSWLPFRPAAMLAVLLLGSDRHRSLLAASHGRHRIREPAGLAKPSAASWAVRLPRPAKAPRYIVCDRGVQFDCDGFRKWCRTEGKQAATLWSHRPARLDCRGGASHLDDQMLAFVFAVCALSARSLLERASGRHRMVQRGSAAHPAWRQDAE